MFFLINYAFKEILKRPLRSLFISTIIALIITSFLITESSIKAMLYSRSRILEPLSKANINLVVSSNGNTIDNNSNQVITINLEGRNLKPGQNFIEDTLKLDSLKGITIDKLSFLLNNKYINDLSSFIILPDSRLEGKTPEKIFVPQNEIQPLTDIEREQINSRLAGNQQYINLQNEMLRLRELVINDKATTEDKKNMENIGQQLMDIEFNYYPERLKKTKEISITPTSANVQNKEIFIAGIDINKQIIILKKSDIVEGRFFTNDDKSKIILREDYAKGNGFKVGDTYKFKAKDFTVIGLARPEVGLSSAQVYMSISELQEIIKSKDINMILIKVNGPSHVNEIKDLVKNNLPEMQVVEANNYSTQINSSLNGTQFMAINYAKIILLIVTLSSFIMVCIVIISNLSQRKSDLKTLQVIGWSKKRIALQVSTELILQTLLGAILGGIFTYIITILLNSYKINIGFDMTALDRNIIGVSNKAFELFVIQFDLLLLIKATIIMLLLLFIMGYLLVTIYIRKFNVQIIGQVNE